MQQNRKEVSSNSLFISLNEVVKSIVEIFSICSDDITSLIDSENCTVRICMEHKHMKILKPVKTLSK